MPEDRLRHFAGIEMLELLAIEAGRLLELLAGDVAAQGE